MRTQRWVWAAACCLAAWIGPASAEITPGTISPPPSVPTSEGTESIQLPAIEFVPASGGDGAPTPLRAAPVVDADDKGSFYTDAGGGRGPAQLTPGEEAKLAMARAAVAAAYAAGHLPMVLPEELGPALSEEEINTAKLRLLNQPRPVDPAAPADPGLVGLENLTPVQENGPDALNEVERAKLEGREIIGPAVDPTSTVPPAAGDASQPGLDADLPRDPQATQEVK